ncbi:sensor domain-containing protein [Kribbella sp. NPDC051952]|uniref:sensor histidine kinase n=1 Tax=Kribbella sp. NPDC051952 TaxID=3154851 RepID=UPI00343578B7
METTATTCPVPSGPRTVWAALASPRYVISSWPWRSYAYLFTSIPVGVLTIAVLIAAAAVSAVLSPILIGVLMLMAFPLIGASVGRIERWRAGLVLVDGIPSPHAKLPATLSVREKLKFRRREQASVRALGYSFVLGVFVWLISAAFAGICAATLGITLAAPVIADTEEMGMGPWVLDSAREGLIFLVAFGPPFFVVSSYLIGVIAAAEASLAKAMLGPRQEELQRNVAELRRSRLDLVDAFETERARIERHLHDGVQQRLVGLTMTLGLAELDLPEGEGRRLVVKAHSEAEAALADLRAAVRGIHPRVLVDHGLEAAVREVADRMPLPVTVQMSLPERLPAPIEAAAYFVVSEALANVAKHAQASTCEVTGWIDREQLVIGITDDGVGGATLGAGSGLTGLVTRLDALGGTLVIDSPPGGPTRLRMECPCRLGD